MFSLNFYNFTAKKVTELPYIQFIFHGKELLGFILFINVPLFPILLLLMSGPIFQFLAIMN